jgi:hypothetical protein
MRWPFRGSSIDAYLYVFEQCLDVPAGERAGLQAEVRSHLEEAADAIAGPRPEAEVHATRLLGSPRDLAARIGAARRHRRPERVLVIDPPVQYVKYETPGEPTRFHRRDLAGGLAFPAYFLLDYWAGVTFGHHGPTLVIPAAIAIVIGVTGRWLLPRLTPTETSRFLVSFMGLIMLAAVFTGTLHLARVVQGDPVFWAGPLVYAAVLAAAGGYRLLNPTSPLVIGPSGFVDKANTPE